MDYKEMMKKWREGKNETVNEFGKGFNNEKEEDSEEEQSEEDPWKKQKEALQRIKDRNKNKL